MPVIIGKVGLAAYSEIREVINVILCSDAGSVAGFPLGDLLNIGDLFRRGENVLRVL